MQTKMLTCSPDTSLHDVVSKMQVAKYSSIVILEENCPIGIWTEADALKLNLTEPAVLSHPISDYMSTPVATVKHNESLADIAIRFKQENFRHLIVVDNDGSSLGIVTQSDVVAKQTTESFLYLRTVKEIISQDLLLFPSDMDFQKVITAMRESQQDACAISFPKHEYGILTERDVVKVLAAKKHIYTLEEVIEPGLITIDAEQTLIAARDLLLECNIRHLGITNDAAELIAIISFNDILKSIQLDYVYQLEEALKQRDEALKHAKKDLLLAHSVLESATEGVMVVDVQGKIEMVNPAFSNVTGYRSDEVLGKRPNILKSGRHDKDFYRNMWRQLNGNHYWQGEIWNRKKSGELYPEWLTITAIVDNHKTVQGYAGIFTDISERKKVEERIKNLAYYDILTGLPNRRLFADRLSIAISNAKRHGHKLGLMFLDLDLFKRINDSLGHSAGDTILQKVSARLSECVREGDTLARLGGDEFTIVLAELDESMEATWVAQRIIKAMKKPIVVAGQELFITFSIGISFFPEDGIDAESLIKHADTAMYRIKDLGRNGFELYSTSMSHRSLERLAMESSLHQAIKNNELFLTYQAKLDLETRKMVGVEALIRWNHPELGIIMPGEFIPLAEKSGLIQEIGRWVLNEACRQNQHWQEQGLPPITMAVNVSTHQFTRSELFDIVTEALKTSGLAAKYLELEVTESSVMKDIEMALKTLNRLHKLGVTVAIDDFGTGFSSLSYLKDMPVDLLKIDQSFLHNFPNDKKNTAIVISIIGLAKQLGIQIIAEGVETEEQVAFLLQENCDQVQGFLIARPMVADNINNLFEQRLLN